MGVDFERDIDPGLPTTWTRADPLLEPAQAGSQSAEYSTIKRINTAIFLSMTFMTFPVNLVRDSILKVLPRGILVLLGDGVLAVSLTPSTPLGDPFLRITILC